MIKFTCIDSDKADAAKQKLLMLGLDVKVIDRTILALGSYTNQVIAIMCDAMAYTETPNEWDVGQL